MITIVKRDDVTFTIGTKGFSGQLFFTVKRKQDLKVDDDTLAVISKDVAITGDETELILTNQDTDIDVGTYVYDIQIVDGGKVSSTAAQDFRVLQDVTVRTS